MTIAEKLLKIAENEQKVYEAGQKSEYDRFTLEITNRITVNNTRVHYNNALCYGDWGGLKFAYPIKPTGNMAQIFYNSPMTELPTPLDFSEIMTKASANSYTYRRGVFAYCTNLKEIDFSAETGINMRAIDGLEEWFLGCRKLETIKGLNVHEGTIFNTSNSNGAFNICDALVNLTFANGSVIGKSLDIHWSIKLSMESVQNIFSCLGGTTASTLTLPASHNDGRYDSLIASKPSNWTVSFL
jgi:hypothetical protein